MPDGDCASVDVELATVESKLALASENLRAEGLVDFEPIDLRQAQASQVQQSLDCRYWRDAHDLWADANHGTSHHARQGIFLVLLQVCARSHQGRRPTVYDSGAVPACLHSAKC